VLFDAVLHCSSTMSVLQGTAIDRPRSVDSQPQVHLSFQQQQQQQQQQDALLRQLQDSLTQFPPGPATSAAGQLFPRFLK